MLILAIPRFSGFTKSRARLPTKTYASINRFQPPAGYAGSLPSYYWKYIAPNNFRLARRILCATRANSLFANLPEILNFIRLDRQNWKGKDLLLVCLPHYYHYYLIINLSYSHLFLELTIAVADSVDAPRLNTFRKWTAGCSDVVEST